MIQFILLILTLIFGYYAIKAETPEKKLKFITISIFIDLAWLAVSLYQHEYFWSFLWFLVSLLDLKSYKKYQDEINQ
jgi:Mg2+ and Co2+ transporter CorA